MSDIRVSVQWKSSTIFAGEHIDCTITFKNVAQAHSFPRTPSPDTRIRQHNSDREQCRRSIPMRPSQGTANGGHKRSPSTPALSQTNANIHKPALSLSTSNGFPYSPSSELRQSATEMSKSGNNKHRRSVSIVSIGGEVNNEPQAPGQTLKHSRAVCGHARAASLQVLPRRTGTTSAPGHEKAFPIPSPLIRSATSFAEQNYSAPSITRPKVQGNADAHSGTTFAKKQGRTALSGLSPLYRSNEPPPTLGHLPSCSSSRSSDLFRRNLSPRPKTLTKSLDQTSSMTTVLSPASPDGTPRSSADFYPMSNNSAETLASEYVSHEKDGLKMGPAVSRHSSFPEHTIPPRSDILMMGYAQIVGSCTLDGSLINQSHFAEAKRKGVVGGQGGGGVVRRESTKRDSGLLGSLGWGNIGGSLGGLLGANEMSSIKEGQGTSNTREIPVLSTPQAVLFVDLHLAPGESRSYAYSHPLPRGIPPSHKGRAIKIAYSLVVGTQRSANKSSQHEIQHANVPFRVLTSVTKQGETLGHDLMSPHTMLSDMATVSSVERNQSNADHWAKRATLGTVESTPMDFNSYIQSLLSPSRPNGNTSLLSPTDTDNGFETPVAETSKSMKELVDGIIFSCTTAVPSKRSSSRYEITRSGNRIAVIMLMRSAYRLGETIPVAIDFGDSDIPCYSLNSSLETSEAIDPAIALRSKASIQRVTRRIYASQREPTIAAKKVIFSPMIPSTSTPDFITSGVNLEWKLRFEFVTNQFGNVGEDIVDQRDLMEEVARDDRGVVKAALQGLSCETFDVTVPLRIYGAAAGSDDKAKTMDYPI